MSIKPYFQKGGQTIYHGDAIEILQAIEASSVDAVVTDPPYGQSNEDYDSSVAFRIDLWAECFRVAKDNAALVSFAGSPTYHRIASAIDQAGWRVRQMWGWIYRDGMITSAWPKEGFDRLAPSMDPICFATQGKVLLTLSREGEAWKTWFSRATQRREYSGRSASVSAREEADGHWPRTLVSDGSEPFEYFVLSRGNFSSRRSDTEHTNEKPVPLMKWITAKLPSGTILDPFMGSGITGIAAMRTGHSFVGIEVQERYCEMAARRLDQEMTPFCLDSER